MQCNINHWGWLDRNNGDHTSSEQDRQKYRPTNVTTIHLQFCPCFMESENVDPRWQLEQLVKRIFLLLDNFKRHMLVVETVSAKKLGNIFC